MKIHTKDEAQRYLDQFIPQDTVFKFPAKKGLERTKYLASLLGDPQERTNVIHIAGTSGKGSTAFFTEALLRAQGFKTGLHISPHLVDLRERFQVDGQLLKNKVFFKYLEEIIPAISSMKSTKYGTPTYFEIITVLAYYIFYKKKVDYAIVETGLGGWFDATNIVSSQNKLCIITRIGLDHTRILGNTLSKIALQKVHIVKGQNQVICIKQKNSAQKVIENFVKKQKGKLLIVSKKKNQYLRPEGEFQEENSALAMAALNYLSKRDKFQVNEVKTNIALSNLTIKGRFEIFEKKGKKIILDGAHNPQKMKAFTSSLRNKLQGQKFTFLIAFKEGKDFRGMLKYIIPLAQKIIITQFWVDTTYSKLSLSQSPKMVGKVLKKEDFKNYSIVKKSEEALKLAIKEVDDVVITGSLYFVGEIYPLLT